MKKMGGFFTRASIFSLQDIKNRLQNIMDRFLNRADTGKAKGINKSLKGLKQGRLIKNSRKNNKKALLQELFYNHLLKRRTHYFSDSF